MRAHAFRFVFALALVSLCGACLTSGEFDPVYCKLGLHELIIVHLAPHVIDADMNIYPDLQVGYGATNYRAGLAHWIAHGRFEGRISFANGCPGLSYVSNLVCV